MRNQARESGYVAPERLGFQDITESQRRHLDATAVDVLSNYGALRGAQASLVAAHSNVIYRVVSRGCQFALRIGAPPTMECVDISSELTWMAAVGRGGIAVPEPLKNDAGSFVTLVRNRDTGILSQCVILGWLPGTPAAANLTVDACRLVGGVSAALHNISEAWDVPADLRGLVWDKVFYYPGIPVRLPDAPSDHITRELRDVIAFLVERADTALGNLYVQGKPRPIHGNIESWNVLIDGGRAALLDFEELTFGFPVQDIAVTLHYLKSHPRFPELSGAYRRGYEEHRPWPDKHQELIPLLSAARTMMLMNHALSFHCDPGPFIERSTPSLMTTARQMGI